MQIQSQIDCAEEIHCTGMRGLDLQQPCRCRQDAASYVSTTGPQRLISLHASTQEMRLGRYRVPLISAHAYTGSL